ncbi:hypothetical protein P886_2518 [Alteromonadaceae bacterium 2753L.S.0a.02]|nr:hypothetical protein P886_2518 [Alteromonadaceae bacterium 2753L.S.0a.02]
MRILLVMCGWLAVAVGVVGIFLPLLPTTPFILLAAACFAKSSQRFHQWLLQNHWFGPAIRDWQRYRALRKHVKAQALALVVASFSLSIAIVPLPGVRLFLVATMLTCLYFISRLPVRDEVRKKNRWPI